MKKLFLLVGICILLMLPIASSGSVIKPDCTQNCQNLANGYFDGCMDAGGNYWDCWSGKIIVYCTCLSNGQCDAMCPTN